MPIRDQSYLTAHDPDDVQPDAGERPAARVLCSAPDPAAPSQI
jgi:hypothetical protein